MQIEKTFIKPPQYDFLKQLISQGNNLYILGMPGCGKTTLVRKILKDLNIPFSIINFLQCSTKESLLNTMCQRLSELWQVPFKLTNKFSQLALYIHELLEYLAPDSLEQNRHSFQSFRKRCYIVLDTPALPQIGSQSYDKLFNLTNQKNSLLKMNIILISNTLPQQYELPMYPKLIINTWSDKLILELIYQHTLQMQNAQKFQKILEIPPELVDRLCQEFGRDVVNTFCVHSKNLSFLLRISQELSEQFVFRMYSRFVDEQGAGNNQTNVLKRNDFIEAKKILLDNPYLRMNTAYFKKLIDKSQNRDNQEQILKNQYKADRKQLVQAVQALGTEEQQIKLPRMPAVLLLASYLASKNPERSNQFERQYQKADKYIFKDYKRKKKSKASKKKQEELKMKSKFTQMRLVSLAQCLMSIMIDIKDLQREFQRFNHSILFYQQIEKLIDLGYLQKYNSKDDELNRVKYECKITEKQAFQLAEDLKINFYEFLYTQSSTF